MWQKGEAISSDDGQAAGRSGVVLACVCVCVCAVCVFGLTKGGLPFTASQAYIPYHTVNRLSFCFSLEPAPSRRLIDEGAYCLTSQRCSPRTESALIYPPQTASYPSINQSHSTPTISHPIATHSPVYRPLRHHPSLFCFICNNPADILFTLTSPNSRPGHNSANSCQACRADIISISSSL
jgi:hypothetical protein